MLQFRINDYLYSVIRYPTERVLIRGEIHNAPEQCSTRGGYLYTEPTSRILYDALNDSGLKTREQRVDWIRERNPNFS